MKCAVILALAAFAVFTPLTKGTKNVVCYFASWTVYRPNNGQFDIDNIDPNLCTHIYFAFLGINPDATIRIIDPWESDDDGKRGFRQLVALKEKNPDLKVLVSMGGWNEGAGNFSLVAKDPTLRKKLASEVVSFINSYGFDGFDIDWEYPAKRDSLYPDLDKDDFTALLEDLKTSLKSYHYLLTAAVSGAAYTVDISYDVPKVNELLDLINVMVYDFHGHFEPYVGHLSPLYKSSLDVGDENKTLNVATGIEYWIQQGAEPSKLHLGIPTYGRSFTLADVTQTGLYAPTTGGGVAGPYTRQEGFLGYNEICELHSDWEYHWDDEQKVPHRISGNQWVGYEDTTSITYKALYAKSKSLGGMMLWAFDTDDFRGICGDAYPLLTTINKVLQS